MKLTKNKIKKKPMKIYNSLVKQVIAKAKDSLSSNGKLSLDEVKYLIEQCMVESDGGFYDEEVEESVETVLDLISAKMEVLNASYESFIGGGDIVTVMARSALRQKAFIVQLVDGKYRKSIGSWIVEQDSGGDEVEVDDYFDFDFNEIVDAAESCALSEIKRECTGAYHESGLELLLLEYGRKVKVSVHNNNYINRHYSRYENEFDHLMSFCSRIDAQRWINANYGNG